MDQKTPTRDKMVTFRMTTAGLDWVDSRRGTWTRGEYIRQAIKAANLTGPQPPTEQPGTVIRL